MEYRREDRIFAIPNRLDGKGCLRLPSHAGGDPAGQGASVRGSGGRLGGDEALYAPGPLLGRSRGRRRQGDEFDERDRGQDRGDGRWQPVSPRSRTTRIWCRISTSSAAGSAGDPPGAAQGALEARHYARRPQHLPALLPGRDVQARRLEDLLRVPPARGRRGDGRAADPVPAKPAALTPPNSSQQVFTETSL